MKICSRCKETKLLDEFFVSRQSRAKDGKHNNCKQCCREYGKRWRETNPQARKSVRKTDLKSKYGISVEDYEHMLNSQEGKCAICKLDNLDNKRMSVDHCHTTGKVRGLLCNRCNVGLGYFRDNITYLTEAIKYLDSSPS